MPETRRKFIIGLLVFLGAGLLVGWLYGRPEIGALIAVLLAFAWQVRQLLAFNRALQTGDFDRFRLGEGIWQQIYSRFNFEREKSRQYKQDHRRLLKEIRKSTNAMPDGAVILDEANEIIYCNRATKDLAGLKRKKDRGQRIDNILRHPKLAALLHGGNAGATIDIESPVKDGCWLNCRVVPYGADQKLLLLRDVTERIVLNKMRRDFVANASHELRSPLTVINGYLDGMAEDGRLPEDWAQPVSQMRDQAVRMNRIISELLELSRLEASGNATMEETVEVAGLLAAGRKAFADRPDAPKIVLEEPSNVRIRGEIGEIESVITNLLSNAVRHTPADGQVTLTWRVGEHGADLVVSDTGEGIPEEHVPRLTERFFRVDRGRARTDGGVGLGLAIVKHVLSRHDAELHVTSRPGEGSEFHCHFPPERIVAAPPIPLAGTGSSS